MRKFALILAILAGPAILAPPSVSAQTTPDSVALYFMEPLSNFQYGCFAPCECPVYSSQALQGTFQLKHVGFDGLFDNYDVTNVQWTSPNGSSGVNITGSGRYRVGGEVAVQKQMVLDLRFGSKPAQKFDSGLISGGNDFPRIEIDVSLHQMTCFDSVIHIQAAPAPATRTTPSVNSGTSSPRAAYIRSAPNPFARGATLMLGLPAPARVDLTIFDPQGRMVRHVTRGTWFPAGVQPVLWDGKREDGREGASGVYFVRARIGEIALVQRIVKAR